MIEIQETIQTNQLQFSIPKASSLIFIDPTVADYQYLISGINSSEIVLLDSTRDGLQQITEALAERSNISDLQIITHSQAGNLQLGTAVLNEKTLASYTDELQNWSKALTSQGDLLFYGCNLAAEPVGKDLVQTLSQLTEADIAASDDLTGSAALGGDWELEVTTGTIEASIAVAIPVLETYNGVLDASFNFSNFSNISNLALNGSAARSGTVLNLTPAVQNKAGSTFYNQSFAVNTDTSFQTRFQFKIQGGNKTSGADGMTFMLQNSPAGLSALGKAGESLGYGDTKANPGSRITNSLAVELDTFKHTWDANANHVSLLRDGNVQVALATSSTPAPPDLNNGSARNVWIEYQGSTDQFKVFISQTTTKPATPLFTKTIDLSAIVGANAFVGFSAATGGKTNTHTLENWEFSLTQTSTDSIPPTASLSAGNVSVGGGSSYDFTVTYSDNVAINTSSIDNSDIRVTGPDGFNQIATLVSVDSSNGSPRTATYRILSPGGTWENTDNGTYSIALLNGQISDTSSNFAAAATLGNFSVNIPLASPPTASLSAGNISVGGSSSYSFNVTYSDDIAIALSSIDNSDIRVTGPDGFNQIATLVSVDSSSNSSPLTATYSIETPGGTWEDTDNGTYSIALLDGQISDTSGNFAAAATLGNFSVNIPIVSRPTASLLVADISVAGASIHDFSVTYSDDVAVNTSSIDSSDIRVTGPDGFNQLASLVSVDNDSNGSPRTAIYRIQAPGGFWSGGDNGVYTLALLANQIKDTEGYFASAKTLGTFQVNTPFSAGAIALAGTPIILSEGGTASITIVRTGGSDGQASIDYTTVNNTATAGDDYIATSGVVTFNDGETSKTVVVNVLDDTLSEDGEAFNLAIDNAVGATLGTKRTTLITIVDRDNEQRTLLFEQSSLAVSENAGTATLNVILNGIPSTNTVTVNYTTSNGTAVAGVDYIATSGIISFAPGEIFQTITIPIIDNLSSTSEGNETFNVSLSNANNANLGVPSSMVVNLADDDTFVRENVVTGLSSPTAFDWTPNGQRMYIAQKNGVVRVFDNGTLLPTPFIDISSQVNNVRDRGLLGIAVHPDFYNGKPYIYLLFTYDPPEVYAPENVSNPNTLAGPDEMGNRPSRLLRVTADANDNYQTAVASSEVVLLGTNSTWANTSRPDLDSTGNTSIPPSGITSEGVNIQDYLATDSQSHSIGAVQFAPDGTLLVSNGDGASYGKVDPRAIRVQDLGNLSGKMIRINALTGQGLSDNPFYDGNPDSNRSKVYNYGLRNPFRFTTHPTTGELYIGDVGWNAWEEIDRGRGVNFGWPYYEGGNGTSVKQSGYSTLPEAQAFYNSGQTVVAPIYGTKHTASVSAIVMGDFYQGTTFPSLYQGALFFADVNSGFVDAAIFNELGQIQSVQRFATNLAGVVQITSGPDSNLYYVNLGQGVIGRWRLAT